MEKAVAARIMEAALSMGNEINKLDSIISELESGREKEVLVQALGDIMGILTRRVVFPIAHAYPDLDPDR
jgi:predicted transcriptional regulator